MKDVQAAQNGGSMFENKTEQQAKDEILKMVAEYCDTYHNKKEYHEGDRIPYASRVYDHEDIRYFNMQFSKNNVVSDFIIIHSQWR